MATLLPSDSRRLYSWWWDSHISPKNSKWLQENLTDMDAKVKAMIKLIEEDADSFARRAEMYYKKRPELMKLVEEFYRAYRALAERYDHATGELRQAHRTMAQAFPNQVPFILPDDSPAGPSAHEREPHTPEMSHPIYALLDPDDLQKDASGLSVSDLHDIKKNGSYSGESDAGIGKKGSKQLHKMFGEGVAQEHAKLAEGRIRKGLKLEKEEKEKTLDDEVLQLSDENRNLKNQILSESERASRAETEIQNLKKTLADLHTEKEAVLLQYQQSMEKQSNLEGELNRARMNSRDLDEQASKAGAEVQTLKEAIFKLEVEREAGFGPENELDDNIANEQICVHHVIEKIEEMKFSLLSYEDEKQQLLVEKSVLLTLIGQLRLEGVETESEKKVLEQEFKIMTEQLVMVQNEKHKLLEMNSQKSYIKLQNSYIKLQDDCSQILDQVSEELVMVQNERDKLLEMNNQLKSEVNVAVQQANTRKAEMDRVLQDQYSRALEQEFRSMFEQLVMVQNERDELLAMNWQLKSEVNMGDQQANTLKAEMERVCVQKEELQKSYLKLLDEYSGVLKQVLQLLTVQNQRDELLEINRQLKSEANMGDQRAYTLEAEMERDVELAAHSHEERCQEIEEFKSKRSFSLEKGIRDSLRDNIPSLEHNILSQPEHVSDNLEPKDVELAAHSHEERCQEIEEFKSKCIFSLEKGIRDSLRDNIPSLEHNILSQPEHVSDNQEPKDVELAARSHEERCQEIEEFKSKCSFSLEKGKQNKDTEFGDDLRDKLNLQKTKAEISEVRNGIVCKLQVSKTVPEPNQEWNKRKILQILDSDARELNSLQTTVEDLRRKLETNKKKKAKHVDLETVKQQLQEVEETIVQLVEVNGQLTKTIEGSPLCSNGKASAEFEETGNVQRKRVLEQARKGSEKIGRLLLEVQKIQYVLLKLEDEKKSKWKNPFSRSRTSITLGDFIYSGRSSRRRKWACLCGCFRPPSNGDGNSINVFS